MSAKKREMPSLPIGIHITYALQYRRCKTDRCRCRESRGHGPYWYAYFKEYIEGRWRMRSRYIGKDSPEMRRQIDKFKEEQ